jgi:hypothetical protein
MYRQIHKYMDESETKTILKGSPHEKKLEESDRIQA